MSKIHKWKKLLLALDRYRQHLMTVVASLLNSGQYKSQANTFKMSVTEQKSRIWYTVYISMINIILTKAH